MHTNYDKSCDDTGIISLTAPKTSAVNTVFEKLILVDSIPGLKIIIVRPLAASRPGRY